MNKDGGVLTSLKKRLKDLTNLYKRKQCLEGLIKNADGTK